MATSKFIRYFQKNDGSPLLGAQIYLVPQGQAFNTTMPLTAHSTRRGYYYRNAVPDGEYDIYINYGSGPILYENNQWIGEKKQSLLAVNFNADGTPVFLETNLTETSNVKSPSSKAIFDYIINRVQSKTNGDDRLNGITPGNWMGHRSGTIAYNSDHIEITTGAETFSGAKFPKLEIGEKYYVQLQAQFLLGTPGRQILVGCNSVVGADTFELSELDDTLKTFKGIITATGTDLNLVQAGGDPDNKYKIKDVRVIQYSVLEKYFEGLITEVQALIASAQTDINKIRSSYIQGNDSTMEGANNWVAAASGALPDLNTQPGKMIMNLTNPGSYQGVKLVFPAENVGDTFFISLKAKLRSGAGCPLQIGQFTPNPNLLNTFTIAPTSTEKTYVGIVTLADVNFTIGALNTYNNGSTFEFDDVYAFKLDAMGRSLKSDIDNLLQGPESKYNTLARVSSFTWAGADLNAKILVWKTLLFICEYSNSKISVYDIRNSYSPQLIKQFSTGTNPRDCKIVNGYLFVVCYGSSEIKVYDISDLANPVLKHTLATGSHPKTMIIADNYIYVPCAGTGNLEKYEIESLTNNSIVITHIENAAVGASPLDVDFNRVEYLGVVGLNDTVRFIHKSIFASMSTFQKAGAEFSTGRFLNKNVFVACDRVNGMLLFLDISTPALPKLISQVKVSIPGEEITIIGNRIYIPQLTETGITSKLDMVDISRIENPQLIKSIELSVSGAGFTSYKSGKLYVSSHFTPFNIDVVNIETGNYIDNQIFDLSEIHNSICVH